MLNKKKVLFVTTVSGVICSAVVASNAAVPEALTTALTGVQTDILAALASTAPVAIAIMGALLVWRYGVKFFKVLAK